MKKFSHTKKPAKFSKNKKNPDTYLYNKTIILVLTKNERLKSQTSKSRLSKFFFQLVQKMKRTSKLKNDKSFVKFPVFHISNKRGSYGSQGSKKNSRIRFSTRQL